MPIKSISYSKFTLERDLRSDLKQGWLEGSNELWHAELLQHEDATRAKLLTNELLRFFCNSRQPFSLIAKDNSNAFFLLTEINSVTLSRDAMIEKELISKAVNLFFDNQAAIDNTLDYYVQVKRKYPEMGNVLNQIMLRLILLPKCAISFFVSAYLTSSQQTSILDQLSLRQNELIKTLRDNHDFKAFLLSEHCQKERKKALEVLKTFTIHDKTLLMDRFTLNTINDIHALNLLRLKRGI